MCAWVRRVDVGEGVTAAAAAASDPALISLLTFTDSGMLERGKKKSTCRETRHSGTCSARLRWNLHLTQTRGGGREREGRGEGSKDRRTGGHR